MKKDMQIKYLSYSNFLEEACFSVWLTEYRFSRYDIQNAWIKYGWSFLHNLWIALAHADFDNATKIIDTWNNYIIDYYKNWLLNRIMDDDDGKQCKNNI